MAGGSKLGAAGRLSSVGLELGLSVVGALLIGSWLDERLGTEPWLALTGVGLGFVAGFRSLLRTLARHQAELEKGHE
ncbi:MAG: AtpZ/AtpI family protein [Myxococcota bacterium]